VRSLLRVLIALLPPGVIRWLGRRQFAGPLQRRIVLLAAAPVRSGEVRIAYGVARGLRFDVSGANPGYGLGTTEPEVQKALRTHLRPGGVLFDVGANVGFFSVLAARLVGPAGRVYAFEPLPENVAALRRNVELNALANVAVRTEAVADRSGEALLERREERAAARLIAERESSPVTDVMTVRTAALDDLVFGGGLPCPDVIKLDVEGAEVRALNGMRRLLDEERPVVICETHGTWDSVCERLALARYDVEPLEPRSRRGAAPWNAHLVARPRLAEGSDA
jgi:FkbM family methyltransferase